MSGMSKIVQFIRNATSLGSQLLFIESGGDNLAANYSRELADYIIYVIDVGKYLISPLVSFD